MSSCGFFDPSKRINHDVEYVTGRHNTGDALKASLVPDLERVGLS